MRHDPAGAAIVVMLRGLKMFGKAQAAGELMSRARQPQFGRPYSLATAQGGNHPARGSIDCLSAQGGALPGLQGSERI